MGDKYVKGSLSAWSCARPAAAARTRAAPPPVGAAMRWAHAASRPRECRAKDLAALLRRSAVPRCAASGRPCAVARRGAEGIRRRRGAPGGSGARRAAHMPHARVFRGAASRVRAHAARLTPRAALASSPPRPPGKLAGVDKKLSASIDHEARHCTRQRLRFARPRLTRRRARARSPTQVVTSIASSPASLSTSPVGPLTGALLRFAWWRLCARATATSDAERAACPQMPARARR